MRVRLCARVLDCFLPPVLLCANWCVHGRFDACACARGGDRVCAYVKMRLQLRAKYCSGACLRRQRMRRVSTADEP
eukprot:3185957-Pleurochrysis_carterae.AAC.1